MTTPPPPNRKRNSLPQAVRKRLQHSARGKINGLAPAVLGRSWREQRGTARIGLYRPGCGGASA